MSDGGYRYYLDRVNGRRPDGSRGPYAMLHRDGCRYARGRRAAKLAQNEWRGAFRSPEKAREDFDTKADPPAGCPRFTCRCVAPPAPGWDTPE